MSGKDNPIGGKESQEQEKESETHPLPLLRVPQEHQTNSHNLCKQRTSCRLMQTLCLLFSASVRQCELYLVDSVGHILLVSPIPLIPTLFPLLNLVSLSLCLCLSLSLHNVYGSRHSLPSSAGR